MSEKRFTLIKKGNGWVVDDNSRKKFYLTPNEVVKLLNEVVKENEQLRNAIQLFLKEADIFSEKATEHDIIAYREIKHFDNKDAYYLACAIAELKKVIE